MQLLDPDQQVIGIAARDEVAAMADFVDRHELGDMVTIADPDGEVWERFGVFGQPTWVFVDADGATTTRFGALGVEGIMAAFESGGFTG